MVVDLGVVSFEDFWEVDVGGVDEHQVACTADGEAVGDGFVGADLAGVGFSLNGEVADCTVETFGCIGKGFDADIDAVGAEMFFNGLRWVEEGVVEEVPNGACTLTLALDECEDIEVEGLDCEFATLLGEEGSTADFSDHVATAVNGFFVLVDVAVFGEVFAPEAFVAG